ncbi:DUF3857 domain-containing protein [Mucilaginibacter gotjawali]|uniref:Uncharacterized protein n=2 Tax=Mucilaginibacter gotjawali TaxID=1550579 RepID=A0A839SAA9_9SPHI|nr:DUF3857 domain-containing protein [Mucilaginibacter gotjawali]MBB3054183.1 hypothetical protein [Mucilaginibacter gotjawali]BAU54454.1 hypothetical protein MgSA37_02630 [Mucilaginibacter gotjawali]
MKPFLFLTFALLTAINLFAQDNIPYAEKAMQIQKDVWGTTVPEFKSTTVPANLANESAVVLARSFSLQRTSKPRIKFMIITAGVTTRTIKLTTYHERVKINDKSALENFSTIEYQKKLDNSTSFLFNKFGNVKDTYIGAKIIKPDGKETIVNTGEEVLLKNEQKDQKGKLAIPGLQAGDILDYYISNSDFSETAAGNSFKDNDNLFVLADEYPVLYYSIDFQYNKKIKVQYINANGAPKFVESNNENDDLLLSLKLRNLPKYQSALWTSPLRQYPYIEIGSTYGAKINTMMGYDYEKDPNASRFENNELGFESAFKEYPGFNEIEGKLKDYFGSHKNLKNAPLDSILKVIYDEWKFNVFCNYSGKELESINDMNYRKARSEYAAIIMSMMLTDLDIDNEVLLVASRNSNTLENVYNMDDMDAMIEINTTRPMYLCFDDIVTHFNEIPVRYQGEKAVELFPKRHNAQRYTFTSSTTTLPVTTSDKNQVEESLQVSLLPSNPQKLKITRLVKEQGESRHSDQKLLLPVQDIDDGYRDIVKGDELAKRLKKNDETKKMVADYTYAFTKEKMDMVKNFTSEIKSQYDQDPEQVTETKIINPALENNSPVFQFSSSFVLNNLVKKAGNNYIIDAGKLTGGFYKLEDKYRKRTIDIYMPCARSFKYSISITIPPGYSAKGMEELAVKKVNKTGLFTSSAVVDGNNLIITVNRVYNNNFEKASDWPLVMELIDAASNFNSQKILLEKKG